MSLPSSYDWRDRLVDDHHEQTVVDSRSRLAWLLAAFVLTLAAIFSRAAWIEVVDGAEYRRLAAQPLERRVRIAPVRGRILARDGSLLAHNRTAIAIQIHYRTLEQPPNAAWLNQQARSRLSAKARRDSVRVQQEADRLRVEQAELHRRLAQLCGVSIAKWNAARGRVQSRVERIADSVNRRRRAQFEKKEKKVSGTFYEKVPDTFFRRVVRVLQPEDRPTSFTPVVVVAEELDYHVVLADVPPAAAERIAARPEEFPGVRLREHTRRAYPAGESAAHVVGHLGVATEAELADQDRYEPGDLVGRMGIERKFESALRGRPGLEVERTDHRGQVIRSEIERPALPGRDLRLTIDPPLQKSAEMFLDAAIRRMRLNQPEKTANAGGAIVVLDCQSGEVVACVSGPRFDPNTLVRGENLEVERLLTATDKPLFHRGVRMAIPPGSVMKTITAIALLESGTVARDEPFFCQGYLHDVRSWRCYVYRHFGVGHDEITLPRALAESCNVYFFHHAPRMGPEELVRWSQRMGLGAKTGVELPGEAAGNLPSREQREADGGTWREGDTRSLAIGQNQLTTTPLQIARAMAAIATGKLVRPTIATFAGEEADSVDTPPRPLGAREATLDAVRRGMRQAVIDPAGTAHDSLSRLAVSVAAKTGTAETGGRGDHAWLAGYAPVEDPRYAFAVVLEHGGGGAEAAGPVARQVLARMVELGMLK
jgi:penicillin-binding protein 2